MDENWGYLYDPPEASIWLIEWEHLYFFYCSSVDTGHFLAENQDFWWCHGAQGIMVDPLSASLHIGYVELSCAVNPVQAISGKI
jgi:hypothetical protein